MKFKILLLIVGLLFFVQLVNLEMVHYHRFQSLAMKNIVGIETIPAPRGMIYDRNGNIIADSYPAYTLFIYPKQFSESQMSKLVKLTGIKRKIIQKKLKKNYRIVRIGKLSLPAASKIEEILDEFPGVRVKIEPVRYYYSDKIVSHFIGYTGEASPDEIKKSELPKISSSDITGKMGIEKEYNNLLMGKKGVEYYQVDVFGRITGKIPGIKDVPPKIGNTLYLTINMNLEKYTDSLFKNYKKGAVIAMNPKTGEILIYYSKPGIPINQIVYEGKEQIWKNLVTSEDAPLFDRVSQGQYPPGSIFKIITAAIGLKNNIVNKETRFEPCTGGIYIGNKYMACWKAHGSLDLIDAIIQSCDVYFYQLGMKIGLDTLSLDAKKIGFGSITGIDLPEEKAGLIPDRGWYNKHFSKKGWGKGVAANLAIGQGEILVTPLQMVTFFSGIANMGVTYTPHLLKYTLSPTGKRIYKPRLQEIQLPLDKSSIALLRDAMLGVIENPKGTAHWTKIPGVKVCGKTGTAQNPHGKDHSLFVAFAPYKNPVIVVFVVVENAGHGTTIAAPIAMKIINRYIKKEVKIGNE